MENDSTRHGERTSASVLGWLTTSANYTVIGSSAPEEYRSTERNKPAATTQHCDTANKPKVNSVSR